MKRTIHHIQLPPDFAQRLLDNQIQYKLASQPSKQVVTNLIQLYTYGVEYYESIRSYKYLYFQKKMNQMFMTGSALQIMNKAPQKQAQIFESPVQKKMKSPKQQQKIQALKIKQKQQKMFNQIMQKTNYSVTSTQTKDILRDTQEKQVTVQKVINEQLQTQKRSLQEKLQQRKKRSLIAKSMSSIQLFQTPTRDSLFDFDSNQKNQKKNSIQSINKGVIRSPIQVDFGSLINQNDQSQQQQEEIKRKKKQSFSCKRVMSTDNLHDAKDEL